MPQRQVTTPRFARSSIQSKRTEPRLNGRNKTSITATTDECHTVIHTKIIALYVEQTDSAQTY